MEKEGLGAFHMMQSAPSVCVINRETKNVYRLPVVFAICTCFSLGVRRENKLADKIAGTVRVSADMNNKVVQTITRIVLQCAVCFVVACLGIMTYPGEKGGSSVAYAQ